MSKAALSSFECERNAHTHTHTQKGAGLLFFGGGGDCPTDAHTHTQVTGRGIAKMECCVVPLQCFLSALHLLVFPSLVAGRAAPFF